MPGPSQDSSVPQLTKEERQAISTALYLKNLTPNDLEFSRRNKSASQPLPAVAEAIDRPLESLDALMRLHKTRGEGLSAFLPMALSLLQVPLADARPADPITLPTDLPAAFGPPIARLIGAIRTANTEISASLSPLKPEERRTLLDTLPTLAGGSEGKLSFVKGPPATKEITDRLLARIDLKRLLGASSALTQAVDAEIPGLRELQHEPLVGTVRFRIGSIPVEISGTGPDVHDGAGGGLCIDLGGNDVYRGRYGAGILASSVLIDLGGDDRYEGTDLCAGAGLLGVGLAYDLGGHDTFRGNALCFGAGLAGVGALMKDGGDDDYKSRAMSQGFGAWGVGLLVDTRGDDRHLIQSLGQGFGCRSGIGWLVDESGEDQYIALGDQAQGSGKAGVGLLSDAEGDDLYSGAAYCQASGVDLGLGSLFDGGGRDSYISDHAATSFADAGAAYLIDLAGDDVYSSRAGACHACAQSRGVAILFDRQGDDLYAAREGRPALATNGALSIFLDSAGADRYMGTPAGGVAGRCGDALSLFLDIDGADRYSDGLSDGEARIDSDGSAALDLPSSDAETPVVPTGPRIGSTPDPGPEAIDALVTEDTEASRTRLISIGVPAFDRILSKHLAFESPENFGMTLRLARLLGGAAKGPILAKLQSPDDTEVRRALQMAAAVGVTEASPRIAELVKRMEVQREAVEAAGVLRVREAVPDILPLAASADTDTVLVSILALERIGDESSVATAEALLTSPEYPVRRCAMRLLSHFTASAASTADRLLADPDERNQRLGIELLGFVGTPESLARAASFLTGGTPGTRIQAMLAVNGRCPPSFRPTLVGLRTDSDPRVRAVAARIDPGR